MAKADRGAAVYIVADSTAPQVNCQPSPVRASKENRHDQDDQRI